jgi:vancomycin resistance protein YoaR
MHSPMAWPPELITRRLWVFPSLVIPLAIAAVAWTTNVSSRGDEVASNVTLAGADVSGLSADEAAGVVKERQVDLLATPIIISVGDRRLTLTAEEMGFTYDYEATLADVLSARHGDGPLSEFLAWADTPLGTVNVADHYSLDTEAARERLSREDFVLAPPVEPVLTSKLSLHTRVVPGSNGVGVDIDGTIDQLRQADVADGTVEIVADEATIHPTVTDATAAEIATTVNRDTETGFLAVFDGTTVAFSGQQLRRHLISNVTDGVMNLSVDVDGLQDEVEGMFPEPGGDFVAPVMEVVDGLPKVITKGHAPDVCCSTKSVARMADEILNDPHAFYKLDSRPEDDVTKLAWADGSAITEPVSEFTTHHQCCQNRVTNIHVIADTVSGLYLFPGETFSLNEYVGPRTREKGYLVDGAIRGGYHVNEVGGGVSQFTTTLFNAAFYAGLDLNEYQSHSVYFSRYPFGREATLSNPRPDLVFTNSTDYPVLVWSTYDDTSITVTMYSTKNVEVEEAEPRITRRGGCRHTEIDRQRTFSDGRVLVDTIVADYRPGDGLNCSGNPIPRRN